MLRRTTAFLSDPAAAAAASMPAAAQSVSQLLASLLPAPASGTVTPPQQRQQDVKQVKPFVEIFNDFRSCLENYKRVQDHSINVLSKSEALRHLLPSSFREGGNLSPSVVGVVPPLCLLATKDEDRVPALLKESLADGCGFHFIGPRLVMHRQANLILSNVPSLPDGALPLWFNDPNGRPTVNQHTESADVATRRSESIAEERRLVALRRHPLKHTPVLLPRCGIGLLDGVLLKETRRHRPGPIGMVAGGLTTVNFPLLYNESAVFVDSAAAAESAAHALHVLRNLSRRYQASASTLARFAQEHMQLARAAEVLEQQGAAELARFPTGPGDEMASLSRYVKDYVLGKLQAPQRQYHTLDDLFFTIPSRDVFVRDAATERALRSWLPRVTLNTGKSDEDQPLRSVLQTSRQNNGDLYRFKSLTREMSFFLEQHEHRRYSAPRHGLTTSTEKSCTNEQQSAAEEVEATAASGQNSKNKNCMKQLESITRRRSCWELVLTRSSDAPPPPPPPAATAPSSPTGATNTQRCLSSNCGVFEWQQLPTSFLIPTYRSKSAAAGGGGGTSQNVERNVIDSIVSNSTNGSSRGEHEEDQETTLAQEQQLVLPVVWVRRLRRNDPLLQPLAGASSDILSAAFPGCASTVNAASVSKFGAPHEPHQQQVSTTVSTKNSSIEPHTLARNGKPIHNSISLHLERAVQQRVAAVAAAAAATPTSSIDTVGPDAASAQQEKKLSDWTKRKWWTVSSLTKAKKSLSPGAEVVQLWIAKPVKHDMLQQQQGVCCSYCNDADVIDASQMKSVTF